MALITSGLCAPLQVAAEAEAAKAAALTAEAAVAATQVGHGLQQLLQSLWRTPAAAVS